MNDMNVFGETNGIALYYLHLQTIFQTKILIKKQTPLSYIVFLFFQFEVIKV